MPNEPVAAPSSGRLRMPGGLEVNRLGFGAMRITGPGVWGQPQDRAEALRVLRRAVDLGVQLIDTADSYGPAVSEELIAEALHPYPAGVVIATKGGLTRPGPTAGRFRMTPGPLKRIAQHTGGTTKQVLIAWLLARSPVMLPIPGTSSVEHLEENVGAAALRLRTDDVRELG